jgi:RimJ/RimL family protein N-acetyltransferase
VSWPGAAARFEGGLVVVEPLSPDHREDLREAAADPRIWRWLGPAPATPEAFAALMESALRASDAVPFAVVDRAAGKAVGMTRFMGLRPADRGLEIGSTWYAPRVWRTGINVETKLLLLTHAFETLGCLRVELKTDVRNDRSRTAILALGAQFEGIFRKHVIVPGIGVRDSAWYSIVDDEWPAVKELLHRRLAAHSSGS